MHYFCTGIIKQKFEKTDFIFYDSIFSQNIILLIGKKVSQQKQQHEQTKTWKKKKTQTRA